MDYLEILSFCAFDIERADKMCKEILGEKNKNNLIANASPIQSRPQSAKR